MQIAPINIFNNKTSNYIQSCKNNSNTSNNFYYNQDIVSFSSKNLASKLPIIDKYIQNLNLCSIIREKESAKLNTIKKHLNENLTIVNTHIKDLTEDYDFLWAIQSEKEKNKLSKIIVSFQMSEPNMSANEITAKIHKIMQENITQNSQELPSLADKKSIKTEYIDKYNNINLFLNEKKNLFTKYSKELELLDIDTYEKLAPIEDKNISLKRTLKLGDNFNRIIAKRAIEKNIELRKTRNDSYKEYYNKYKSVPSIPIGELKRHAADFADKKVLLTLEGLKEEPF